MSSITAIIDNFSISQPSEIVQVCVVFLCDNLKNYHDKNYKQVCSLMWVRVIINII